MRQSTKLGCYDQRSLCYLHDCQEIYILLNWSTLRSDHLPLKKFLNCKTVKNTVDNWAVEIESFKIKFVHIPGKDNVLTDTLSSLIDIDPDVVQEPELKDYEFGHYAFETLPKAKSTPVGETLALVDIVDICEINISYDNAENSVFCKITII